LNRVESRRGKILSRQETRTRKEKEGTGRALCSFHERVISGGEREVSFPGLTWAIGDKKVR